jgi:hypothetical protein
LTIAVILIVAIVMAIIFYKKKHGPYLLHPRLEF